MMYRLVLDGEAVAELLRAEDDERAQLLSGLERLARAPFPDGLATLTDSTGRQNALVRVGAFLVTFWLDHGAREVRVVAIDRF